ncbi:MAG: glycosyltransferase family 2 protein [Desulfurivibrionaceae bacterium]
MKNNIATHGGGSDKSSANMICIVMPAHNEQDNIRASIEKISEAFLALDYDFEIIIVDDGSKDNTVNEIKNILQGYPVRLIKLSRNFGKEHAIIAGLDHADADAVILMDADLQHPMEMLPEFLDKWQQGYDIVYGYREDRRDESWHKRLFTRIFYTLLNSGAEIKIEPGALDFRLLDRRVVEALRSLRERVRFTKGLYAWVGYRSIGIAFMPNQRYAGESSFNRKSLFKLGWDGLTSFSDLPLKLMSSAGAIISFSAVCYAFYIFARTVICGVDLPGWATLTVAISFLGGIQLLSLGVMGYYIRNIFIETKQRPNYIVEEEIASALCITKRNSAE